MPKTFTHGGEKNRNIAAHRPATPLLPAQISTLSKANTETQVLIGKIDFLEDISKHNPAIIRAGMKIEHYGEE